MSELDLKIVSEQMGIAAATLFRIESGRTPDGRTLASILDWLFKEVELNKGNKNDSNIKPT